MRVEVGGKREAFLSYRDVYMINTANKAAAGVSVFPGWPYRWLQ
ncbi:hypothetical protein MTIN_18710 [Moorella thermoacetica]|nr:hypothetical protein MTIN_18710 [Moorella thermoacetica]